MSGPVEWTATRLAREASWKVYRMTVEGIEWMRNANGKVRRFRSAETANAAIAKSKQTPGDAS